MDLRPYRADDRHACLALLQPSPDLEAFLTAPAGPFFVMEHDGALIGCGGYVTEARTARLVWGVIRPDMRRQGLGRFLLMYRLREIGKLGSIETVSVDVPPEFAPFFEKQGFHTSGARDGRTVLVKRLTVCA
jgi:N-acetylglutamate synthase-like GNAT family acetyltransferase